MDGTDSAAAMAAQLPCPIPEVQSALAPYIRPRHDALRIRRVLSRHLALSTRMDPPSRSDIVRGHLDSTCPIFPSNVDSVPVEARGSLLAYLHALQADVGARNHHSTLRASIKDLCLHHNMSTRAMENTGFDDEALCNYVHLLQKRNRCAQLRIIQDAILKLIESRPKPDDPLSIVRTVVGEQPNFAAAHVGPSPSTHTMQNWIHQLKKDLLEAKAALQRAKVQKSEAQRHTGSVDRTVDGIRLQIYALDGARRKLVLWIETQLAKIGDGDTESLENASPAGITAKSEERPDGTRSSEQTDQLYCEYTALRAALIDSICTLDCSNAEHIPRLFKSPSVDLIRRPFDASAGVLEMAGMFPPELISSVADRAVLQRTLDLRDHLTSTSEITEKAVLRLSTESQVLKSTSKEVAAWRDAAQRGNTAYEDYVLAKLDDSRNAQEVEKTFAYIRLKEKLYSMYR